jgi:uncharacterized protein
VKRFLLRVLRTLAIVYGAAILFVVGCQRSMLYFPSKYSEPAAIARAEREGLTPWRNAAGELIGWRQPNAKARHRMVVFHGNAGSASDRSYYVEAFQALSGGTDWEVFLFEYPGYGSRAGSPGKDPFITAGRAAVEELLSADPRPVFVLGESIGSGTASVLAGDLPERIAGVMLVIPFSRLQEVAQKRFPFLPTSLLLRDKFDNPAALAKYRGPLAVVVAEEDDVLGAEQGHKVHAAYTTGPKLLIILPGSHHNDFPTHIGAAWIREASEFVLKGK